MKSLTLMLLAAAVGIACADGEYFTPESYYVLYSNGIRSPITRLKRSTIENLRQTRSVPIHGSGTSSTAGASTGSRHGPYGSETTSNARAETHSQNNGGHGGGHGFRQNTNFAHAGTSNTYNPGFQFPVYDFSFPNFGYFPRTPYGPSLHSRFGDDDDDNVNGISVSSSSKTDKDGKTVYTVKHESRGGGGLESRFGEETIEDDGNSKGVYVSSNSYTDKDGVVHRETHHGRL